MERGRPNMLAMMRDNTVESQGELLMMDIA